MSSWRQQTLGDLIELHDNRRVPLNSRQRAERQGEYPYYGAQGIVDYIDDFRYDGRFLLIPEDGENLNSRKLPIAYFATGKFWVNNHAHVVQGKVGVADDEFLKHAINNLSISAYVTGAAQPKLSQANLLRISLLAPDYAEQKRVASVLSTYDDLIEVNQRRIAILEKMAGRLFEEWFVNYRYPGHEVQETAETSLGLVPTAWPITRADDLIDFDPQTFVAKNGDKVFVPMGSLSTSSMVISDWIKRSGNAGSKFQNNDTLLARITPCLENGKTGFVDFLNDGEAAFGSTEYIVMRGRSAPPTFVYLLARSERFRATAIRSMGGADGRQRVRSEALQQFLLASPPSNLLKRFDALVEPMFQQVRTLAETISRLRNAREVLLPKLIPGEISVGQVETHLEAAE